MRVEAATGSLTVVLKKETDYTFLFWADRGTADANTGYWDATKLQEVKVADGKETTTGEAAYCFVVSFNSKDFELHKDVKLKNATAQVNFVESLGLETANNTLTVSYATGAKLDVATGKVTEVAGAVTHTFTGIAKAAAGVTLATDYVLAPLNEKSVLNIEMQFNAETKKELANVPFQQSYKTNIKGEFSNLYTSVFTISNEVDDYENNPDVEFPAVMSMTIDTRKNTATLDDKTFILPMAGVFSGYDFTVEWGGGTSDTFNSGTTLTETNMTHTYPTAGEYTLSIISTQLDPAQQQMLKLDFWTNYRGEGNNPAKLISLNSPLLNMGADLSHCFRICSNLTSIPGTLFANNTAATDFLSCFSGCSGLTGEIPATLFTANTKATNFSRCFQGCTNLTSIPADLFENNTEATSFSGCFSKCTGLTAVPELLFATNTEATDFSGCFSGCMGLISIPATLFANNTVATTFSYCFSKCTGLTAVPELLFATNTEATSFLWCFKDCTKLKLNANIFCNEATDKTTRFAGKRMDFSSCFYNCGSDASIGVGEGGTAPALWEYSMDNAYSSRCFYKATKVTNAGEIPEGWK